MEAFSVAASALYATCVFRELRRTNFKTGFAISRAAPQALQCSPFLFLEAIFHGLGYPTQTTPPNQSFFLL
jgi:hypothetical protein